MPKRKYPRPTIDAMRKLWKYDPATGQLTSLRSGKPIMARRNGYVYLRFRLSCGRQMNLAGHRVAWALHYGQWPHGQLDHINRVRHDNRIANLREVTHADNMRNKACYQAVIPTTHPSGGWVVNRRVHGKTDYQYFARLQDAEQRCREIEHARKTGEPLPPVKNAGGWRGLKKQGLA